jgi:hypothetical protein
MVPDLRGEKASITLATLCFSIVLAIALASYLALCHTSYDSSMRLVHDGQSRELAQVGLEEGLWALNQNDWSSAGSGSGSAWTASGSDRSVTLTYSGLGQGASGQLVVKVANYASAGPVWPTITSAATVTLSDGRVFTKTLQSTTGPTPLFGNAIASVNSYVSFGTGGTVDSWDSDPDNNSATAAVGYAFSASDPNNYAAVVSGNDDGSYGVVLNQARVNGYVTTSGKPISYSTSGSPRGKVKGPSTPAATDVDGSRLGQSAFVPASSVFTVTPPAASGPNFGGLLGNVLALVNALLGAPSTAEIYRINGDLSILGIPLLSPNLTVDNRAMKLIIDGNLNITGAGKIIVNANSSLEIFVAGNVTIGGNGIQNLTHDPKKVAIFCTSGSTTSAVQYTSSADFYGVIYSENKPIDIRQNATLYGALLSGQYVRFSASATAPILHYDLSLRRTRFSNVSTPFLLGEVTEL